MAINNINALVDLEGLNNLNNSDYVSRYYNAGLANQGQRWTNEALLEYKHFNIINLIAFRYYANTISDINIANGENPYSLIPNNKTQYFNDKSYLVITQKNQNSIFTLENLSFKVCNPQNNNIIIDLNTIDDNNFDTINNDNIDSIVFAKKLWIIKKLYEKVIYDIAYDSKSKEDYASSFNDSYEHDDIYSLDENVYKNYNSLELWIPLNYSFEYICDGINKSVIYGDHKNIAVYIEPISIDNVDNPVWNDPNKSGIIYIKTSRKYVKTCIYNFAFTKESEIPTILRSNVLPFIDDENYWWINNTPTPIIAKAEKPTNLNIILAYLYKSGNSNEFKILSGLSQDFTNFISVDYLSSREVWIKRHNGAVFPIICKVPIISKIQNNISDEKVKEDIVKILENSTIILMTKLTKLLDNTDDDIKKEYKDGLITTIWSYKEEKVIDTSTNESNDYDYISIEQDDKGHNIALDFGEITNFSNLINFKVNDIEQIKPDNFTNRHIIFEQVFKQNKQETNQNNIYPVLQNIKGVNYNNEYINNFNFSLRYVNNIDGDINKSINSVSNTNDNKYFKVLSDSITTNSLYKVIKNNRTERDEEYIPNYNVPVFDLSEVLVKDSNTMNRQNIISFTNTGLAYYAYIGTSFESFDKSVLHIGTSNRNINLGEYSLIDTINKNNFKKHSTISIDFTYSYLNSYTYVQNDLTVGENIYFNKCNFNKKSIGGYEVYNTQIIPIYQYINNGDKGNIQFIVNINYMVRDLNSILNIIELTQEYNNSNNLYIVNILLNHNINDTEYYYKYNDLIYINSLIKYLGITENINTIISNTNKIIYKDDVPKFIISSNNLLSNSINITSSSDMGVTIGIQDRKKIYVGNQLDITLFKQSGNNILIIDEIQSNKIKSIWKLPEHIDIDI